MKMSWSPFLCLVVGEVQLAFQGSVDFDWNITETLLMMWHFDLRAVSSKDASN